MTFLCLVIFASDRHRKTICPTSATASCSTKAPRFFAGPSHGQASLFLDDAEDAIARIGVRTIRSARDPYPVVVCRGLI
jgi:hypothetical protein